VGELISILYCGILTHLHQYLPPFLEGLWPEHQDLLLRIFHHLAVIHLYIKSFTVHTEVTLEHLQEHIDSYNKLTQVCAHFGLSAFGD
jgi:hypothetical protein